MTSNLTTNLDRTLPQAATRLQQIPKVTPEVMMIVYLDEIAGRLSELQDTLAEVTAEGVLQGVSLTVRDEPMLFPIVARHFSLKNDGSSSIYLLQNKGKPLSRDAEIKDKGEINLDFGTRRQRDFYLVCSSGETATVRIFTW